MDDQGHNNSVEEVVGLFHDDESLQSAIYSLAKAKFDRYEISVLGNETELKNKFGVKSIDSKTLVNNPDAPRESNVAPEEIGIAQGAVVGGGLLTGVIAALVAVGGIIVPAAIPAALIGGTTGAALSALLAKLLGDKHNESLQQQIEKGGLILWVQTNSHEKRELAYKILKEHGAEEIDLQHTNA